jgi:hypothetical protein
VATIENQTFGFEFEFYGLTRKEACQVVARTIGGTEPRISTKNYYTIDNQGRTWKVVYDGSIHNTRGEACELVTPILRYEDIEKLQEIIRALREAKIGVNASCGIHIHVGADQHDSRSLKNLINLFSAKQDMIYRSLEILSQRENRYCKKIENNLIETIASKKPKNLNDLGEIWYGSEIERNMTHYNSTRYHGLNLHNVWYGSTVEFRLFNSTTHAGKIKAYIQFCLAMSAQAINSRSISSKKTISDNEKYTFRTWLLRLGLIGDEFKTCRHHMLAKLEGNSAWRNGIAQ